MTKSIYLFTLGLAAVAAQASSYNVTFFQKSNLNGTDLKPGSYKLELKENLIVLKQGKSNVEAPVTTEEVPKKFGDTSVRYGAAGEVQEIRLGGTNKKLVVGSVSKPTQSTR